MLQIQLTSSPNQTLSVTLAQQNAQIAVRQNGPYLYFDLALDGEPIVTGVLCQDRQPLLLAAQYRGFVGELKWYDTAGTSKPFYAGIGTRFFLRYLDPGEEG